MQAPLNVRLLNVRQRLAHPMKWGQTAWMEAISLLASTMTDCTELLNLRTLGNMTFIVPRGKVMPTIGGIPLQQCFSHPVITLPRFLSLESPGIYFADWQVLLHEAFGPERYQLSAKLRSMMLAGLTANGRWVYGKIGYRRYELPISQKVEVESITVPRLYKTPRKIAAEPGYDGWHSIWAVLLSGLKTANSQRGGPLSERLEILDELNEKMIEAHLLPKPRQEKAIAQPSTITITSRPPYRGGVRRYK